MGGRVWFRRASSSAMCLLLLLALSPGAFGQAGNGQITGIVQDASGAVIPGVDITLTNTLTGVVNRAISNESGAYNFPSVLPSVNPAYRLTAELPGFQTAVFSDIAIGTGVTQRYDFTLRIGAVTDSIEVSVSAQQLLTESSATVGEVLPDYRIRELPLISNNVLDLVDIMPGVFGDSFAGTNTSQVNTIRDGLSVSDGRFNSGVFATTVINPDLVGEIRVILTPVDAEMGRGNAQVQIQTRSGTNRYTGAATWNVTNSAFRANTWANNRNISPETGLWSPTPIPWQNQHSYTISYGGPIVRNKTFFYTVWEQQLNYQRSLVSGRVMTDMARQGIFRYFEGWNNGHADSVLNPTGTNPTWPTVNHQGEVQFPTHFPNSTSNGVGALQGTAYGPGEGARCFSVFGTVKVDGTPFTAADCGPGFTPLFPAAGAVSWDALRTGFDTTGYIQKVLDAMPRANFFGAGSDGLNYAQHRWIRGRQGAAGAAVTTGTQGNTNRKQINIKVDHHFNSMHKLSFNWTHERVASTNDEPNWPNGLAYLIERYPHVMTVNFTSTLTPTIVNEARWGMRYNWAEVRAPWEQPELRDRAMEYVMPVNDAMFATVVPGLGNFQFGGITAAGMMNVGTGQLGPSQYNGNHTPLYNYANTVSWTLGVHALRIGTEARITSSTSYNNAPTFPYPRVFGGAGGNTSPLSNQTALLPRSVGNTRTNSANMLYFLTGSVNNAQMLYWIRGEADKEAGVWQDVSTGEFRNWRSVHQNEYMFFLQDNWKLTRNLTLNLGIRWEYYGSPYMGNGLTTTPVDQGYGLFGVSRPSSGNPFDNWLFQHFANPVFLSGYGTNPAGEPLRCEMPNCNPAAMTTPEFIGPKTKQPDKVGVPQDFNNWGPAVGFAWQMPWLGSRPTTIRGGYQLTYGGSGRVVGGGGATATETVLGSPPGPVSNATTGLGDFGQAYLDLRAIANGVVNPVTGVHHNLVPVRPTSPVVPGGTLDIYRRTGAFSAYDPNFETPYTQNFNLSLERSIHRRMQVAFRYVGTVSKKQQGTINPNLNNFLYNDELWEALEVTRLGGDHPLFDQMLAGLRLANVPTGEGYGPVGTTVILPATETQPERAVLQTGSMHIRRQFATNLANGNYSAIATSLHTLNTAGAGLQALPAGMTGVGGRVLRNGCDRIANGLAGAFAHIQDRCLPENFIGANPQMGNMTFITNMLSSNYHSLQSQFTLSPVQGTSFQATHTWSKQMGLPGTATDPLDRRADYALAGNHRTHDFRTNGTFELPFGPNRLILGNSSGLLANLIGGWRTSIIYSLNSGQQTNIAATSMMYANGTPDIVGPFDLKKVKVRWDEVAGYGTMAGTEHYVQVPDPRCAQYAADSMGFNIGGNCSLNALQDTRTGQIILQHPEPGKRGTFPRQNMVIQNIWSFDANISKSFNIDESKMLTVRVDASNVLNSPRPSNPSLNLNSDEETSPFGRINTKGGQFRNFRGQVRLTF